MRPHLSRLPRSLLAVVLIGVHCRDTGKNKRFATIVVAHRASFNEARGLALNIRRGMETGINE